MIVKVVNKTTIKKSIKIDKCTRCGNEHLIHVEKDIDDQKLVYGSIRGMLAALDDPYTRFVEPKSYKEMKIRMSGSYSGIGIYIGIKKTQLTVISPIDGTPADKARLKGGD